MAGTKRRISSSYAVSKKSKRSPRVPRGIRGGSFASLFRSGYIDVPVTNGQQYPLGFAFNSGGFYMNDVLSAWNGGAEIAAAYDAYRIKKIVMEFTYNQNSSNVNQIANTLPWLLTAIDFDDAGGVAGANITPQALVQKDSVRVDSLATNGGLKITRSFAPKIAVGAYGTAAALGYMEPKANQWVSTGTLGTSDPKHYGMWCYVDASKMTATTVLNGYLRVYMKAYFEMKHSQ